MVKHFFLDNSAEKRVALGLLGIFIKKGKKKKRKNLYGLKPY